MTIVALMGCIVSGIRAQQVNGCVVDSEDNPVAYANVVMHTADSAYVVGTVTDEMWRFALTRKGNEALLYLSYIGYKPLWHRLDGKTESLLCLMPDNQLLNEVLIKGL